MRGKIVVGLIVILLASIAISQLYPVQASAGYNNAYALKGGMHAPIKIEGDANFTPENGVTGGNGTPNDPYIISGLEIDAQDGNNAIYIGNTTAYFIIENCTLSNASYHSIETSGGAIGFYNVRNGMVRNVSAHDTYEGVIAYRSSNDVFTALKLWNLSMGIDLEESDHISISNITIENGDGIELDDSSWNTIKNVTSFEGSRGVSLYGADYNFMENLTLMNESEYGLYIFAYSHYNDAINVTAMGCEDTGVYISLSTYTNITNLNSSHNGDGGSFTRRAGVYVDGDHNRIVNATLNDNQYGVRMDEGDYNEFREINASRNQYGLSLYDANKNKVSDVVAWYNDYGISVDSESNNGYYNDFSNITLWKNGDTAFDIERMYHSNLTDVRVDGEVNMEFARNVSLRDSYIRGDLYLDSSTSNIISNVSLREGSIYFNDDFKTFTMQEIKNTTVNGKEVLYYKNSDLQGVAIPSDAGELMAGNVSNLSAGHMRFENATVGVLLGYSSHIRLGEIFVSNMSKDGIYAVNVDNSSFENITSEYNDKRGMYMDNSANNEVRNMESIGNDWGVYFKDGANNTITNGNFSGNHYGIYLDKVQDTDIKNTSATHNVQYGIYMSGGTRISLQDSIVNDNGYGLKIYGDNNTVENVTALRNRYTGIYLGGSGNVLSKLNSSFNNGTGVEIYGYSSFPRTSNTIYGSSIMNNGDDGIYIRYGQKNTIKGNKIAGNGEQGLYIQYGSENEVKNNIFSGHSHGAYIQNSPGNYLSGNEFYGEGIILSDDFSTMTSQRIENNNTVNGRAIYYFSSANMDNLTVPNNAGEVILGNVSWIILRGVNLSSGDFGIEAGYSSHIFIENCTMSEERINGIYMMNVDNSTIFNNTISKTTDVYISGFYSSGDGIALYGSSNNTFKNNTIMQNSGIGISLDDGSNDNIITGNLMADNIGKGIVVEYNGGSHNQIYENAFFYNAGTGDTYYYGSQASDSGSDNMWYSPAHRGNYWRDWANNNDTNDQSAPYGIVDYPYKISNGVEDKYPLKYWNKSADVPPSAPEHLDAYGEDGYVLLTWDAPETEGTSSITTYRIYRNGTLIAEVPGTQTSYEDKDVIAGVNYTYYVTAVNSAGESLKSNDAYAIPTGEVPEFSQLLFSLIIPIFAVMLWKKKKR